MKNIIISIIIFSFIISGCGNDESPPQKTKFELKKVTQEKINHGYLNGSWEGTGINSNNESIIELTLNINSNNLSITKSNPVSNYFIDENTTQKIIKSGNHFKVDDSNGVAGLIYILNTTNLFFINKHIAIIISKNNISK